MELWVGLAKLLWWSSIALSTLFSKISANGLTMPLLNELYTDSPKRTVLEISVCNSEVDVCHNYNVRKHFC